MIYCHNGYLRLLLRARIWLLVLEPLWKYLFSISLMEWGASVFLETKLHTDSLLLFTILFFTIVKALLDT